MYVEKLADKIAIEVPLKGLCIARFIVSLRPSFLPGPGLGALLSSYLEGALYKFYR